MPELPNSQIQEIESLRKRIAELQGIVDEQSRTVTKLCEAIDPTHTHGPETDKLCTYAVQCREFAENSVLLKRLEALESAVQFQQCDGPQHGGSVVEYLESINVRGKKSNAK